MVWKQDLAKLRQALKASEAPAPKPSPKAPPPKPSGPPKSLAEEDTLFLQAMGQRPAKPDPPARDLSTESLGEPPAPMSDTPEDFLEAMGQLKGLKRGSEGPPVAAPKPPAPAPAPEEKAQTLPTPPSEPVPPVEPTPTPTGPARIQLAAGMAIEVDGSLDLRGHSRVDALERLTERVQDGVFLGWRTFHVTLGPSEDLREAFLAFLASPGASSALARYAQAPVPMGGTQAWILYFAQPSGPRPEIP